MNGFIHTPLPAVVSCLIMFALVIFGGIALARLHEGNVDDHGFRNGTLKTLGIAALGVSVVFGGLGWALHSAQSHNVSWTQEQVKEKYGLGLLEESKGEPAFNFLHDYDKGHWEVEIRNSTPQEYFMELRFDRKSGEPVLSFPNEPGVPLP